MRTRWAAVLLATGLLVAGCGSNGGQGGGPNNPTTPAPVTSAPATSTATASAEVCADAAALEASLNRLVTITIGPGTATELQNDLKDVQSSLTTLVNTARADWQDEIVALQASLTTLQTSVQQLASNPGTTTITAVKAAVDGVRTAARNLFAAVSATCPSLSPSPS